MCLAEMVPGPVSHRVRRLRLALAGRSLAARLLGWGMAIPMGLVSSHLLLARPELASVSFPLVMALLLTWCALYGSLGQRMMESVLGAPGAAATGAIRSRAVAYGLLGAVALAIVATGVLLAWDAMLHWAWTKHLGARIPDMIALVWAGAILLVGLCMGLSMGRESSLNMVVVVLLYASITAPVLGSAAGLAGVRESWSALALIALWGLSGAYVGSFVSGEVSRRALA
jgi:hypothetical protein